MLFPRLPKSVAFDHYAQLKDLPPEKARELRRTAHPLALVAPVGTQVSESRLCAIQDELTNLILECSYPGVRTIGDQQWFDYQAAVCLRRELPISPSEASHVEVWQFLSCILVPDIVIWRHRNHQKRTVSSDRFIGSPRGIRNGLGRLWWRAFLLEDPRWQVDPFAWLQILSENDLVALTERGAISGNRNLALAISEACYPDGYPYPDVPREKLFEEVMKRIRRLRVIIDFESLDRDTIGSIVSSEVRKTITALDRAE